LFDRLAQAESKHDRRAILQLFMVVCWVVGCSLAIVTLRSTWKIVEWTSDYETSRPVMLWLIVAFVALIAVWSTIRDLPRLIYARHLRSFCRYASAEQWTSLLKESDARGQALLLRHVNHAAMQFNPTELLLHLRQLDAFIRDDPAQSAYWARMNELEQI